MSRLEHYFRDVRMHLAAKSADKDRFLTDLREQVMAMQEAGLSEDEIANKLGPPRQVAAEFMQSRPLKYANILERFVAFMLDAALSTMFIFPGVFLLLVVPMGLADPDVFFSFNWGGINPPQVHINAIELVLISLTALTATGIALLYFPVMESVFGWTIGKRVLGMRVLKEDGSPIHLGTALVRRLSYYFDILALDALFIPFTSNRQRAFDMVAKTVVVRDGERNWLGLALLLIGGAIITLIGIYTIVLLSALPEPKIDVF
ncbi:RDD family protein [bacterium]|nr:RDD family protein [bacterium]